MDLVGATFSHFVSNQVCSVFRSPYNCAVVSLCVEVIGKSYAHDIKFMLVGVKGVSSM